jgi:RNA polymerase sigma factor (sigma-70 family)
MKNSFWDKAEFREVISRRLGKIDVQFLEPTVNNGYMPEMNDQALIREYADGHSEVAFAALVRQHIPFVYSVAFRWVGNAHDAQDVTQAVFVILAKKAASLRHRTTLTGWLYETTRFTAAAFLRGQARQRVREHMAYMQSTINNPDANGVWQQVGPVLDEAMGRLNHAERTLLAIRLFENKTAAETAGLLGIREAAAYKRTTRALEKLRRFFLQRGIDSSTALIAEAISTNSIQAAPMALEPVIAAAMRHEARGGGSTATLIKGALKMMFWSKAKTAIVTGVVVLLAAGAGTVALTSIQKPRHVPLGSIDAIVPGELRGRITLPTKSGKATILIIYATLKTNFESSVSMRYPLVPVHAHADSDGNFTIGGLDSRWLYFGWVVAPGCQPKFLEQMDPGAGPLHVSLEAADPHASPNETIHGRVVDSRGQPIPDALIQIQGSTRNGQMNWPAQEVDIFSVSDDAGNFVIYGKTAFNAVDGSVSAEGFAESEFEQWPSDAANEEWTKTGSMPIGLASYAKPLHEIGLLEGASLTGRLLMAGKPVAKAKIRLNGCGIGSHCWNWKGSTLTDDGGRFVFAHFPANQSFSICGDWDLLPSGGAVPQTEVHFGEDGSTNDIGDIKADPVCMVAGKILLSDGKPLPNKSFYYLEDEAMEGSQSSRFDRDGSFHFAAVPGDGVSIFLRIPGYELTPRDFMLMSGSATNITVSPNSNYIFEMRPASRVIKGQ